MSDRSKPPSRDGQDRGRPPHEDGAASARSSEVLFLEPLRWLPDEGREEFAERALQQIKRGLAKRILMQRERRGE